MSETPDNSRVGREDEFDAEIDRILEETRAMAERLLEEKLANLTEEERARARSLANTRRYAP